MGSLSSRGVRSKKRKMQLYKCAIKEALDPSCVDNAVRDTTGFFSIS